MRSGPSQGSHGSPYSTVFFLLAPRPSPEKCGLIVSRNCLGDIPVVFLNATHKLFALLINHTSRPAPRFSHSNPPAAASPAQSSTGESPVPACDQSGPGRPCAVPRLDIPLTDNKSFTLICSWPCSQMNRRIFATPGCFNARISLLLRAINPAAGTRTGDSGAGLPCISRSSNADP